MMCRARNKVDQALGRDRARAISNRGAVEWPLDIAGLNHTEPRGIVE